MKITDIKVDVVNIPYPVPTLASGWWRKGLTKNILQVFTDEGYVGIGEADGGWDTKIDIEKKFVPILKGLNPFNLEDIISKMRIRPARRGNIRALSGLEMAMWDIMGKALNRPVYDLLGGKWRDNILIGGYIFYRAEGPNGEGGERTPDAIVDQCNMLIDKYGFQDLKLKAGVFSSDVDVKTIRAMRQAFPNCRLRIDPNGIWSVEESLRVIRKIIDLDLEYVEDPTLGLQGMTLVRQNIDIPLSTNMCVTSFFELPIAIKLNTVDVVLGDPGWWGGISPMKKLAAVLDTFHKGFCLHSTGELGISTAANLHVSASTPSLKYAMDTHFWMQTDDVIEGGMFGVKNGYMTVPDGPGLGVKIDFDKLEKYSRLNKEQGDNLYERLRHMGWWSY